MLSVLNKIPFTARYFRLRLGRGRQVEPVVAFDVSDAFRTFEAGRYLSLLVNYFFLAWSRPPNFTGFRNQRVF